MARIVDKGIGSESVGSIYLRGDFNMSITYNEVEKTIIEGLYSSKNYGEVKNGNVSILVQTYQPGQWRVQFYHIETRLIVQAEHIMDNDNYTLSLIHEALELLKDATVMKIRNMEKFTQNLLAVRELGDGSYQAEFYPVTCVKDFLQISELFYYDDTIKKMLDGNGNYVNIQKQLAQYGVEL